MDGALATEGAERGAAAGAEEAEGAATGAGELDGELDAEGAARGDATDGGCKGAQDIGAGATGAAAGAAFSAGRTRQETFWNIPVATLVHKYAKETQGLVVRARVLAQGECEPFSSPDKTQSVHPESVHL